MPALAPTNNSAATSFMLEEIVFAAMCVLGVFGARVLGLSARPRVRNPCSMHPHDSNAFLPWLSKVMQREACDAKVIARQFHLCAQSLS